MKVNRLSYKTLILLKNMFCVGKSDHSVLVPISKTPSGMGLIV